MKKRSHIRDMPTEYSGYYGLHRWIVIWHQEGNPIANIGKLYWKFQPLRCLFGWHNWYDVAAGLCSACTCGASLPYPRHIIHKYRWNKTAMRLAAMYEEEKYRANSFQEWYYELRKEVANGSK